MQFRLFFIWMHWLHLHQELHFVPNFHEWLEHFLMLLAEQPFETVCLLVSSHLLEKQDEDVGPTRKISIPVNEYTRPCCKHKTLLKKLEINIIIRSNLLASFVPINLTQVAPWAWNLEWERFRRESKVYYKRILSSVLQETISWQHFSTIQFLYMYNDVTGHLSQMQTF